MKLVHSVLLAVLLVFSTTARADAPETLYARIAMLYEGEVKGYHFTKESFDKYAWTFVNRMVLRDHEWGRTDYAVGRILATRTQFDKSMNLHYMEGLVAIREPRTIRRIQLGLLHYVSVGMSKLYTKCSLDGRRNCRSHRPGSVVITGKGPQKVKRTVDHFIGQELSFVNIPASRWSRVLEISEDPYPIEMPPKDTKWRKIGVKPTKPPAKKAPEKKKPKAITRKNRFGMLRGSVVTFEVSQLFHG